MQQSMTDGNRRYGRGDLVRHRVTGETMMILKDIDPADRDKEIDRYWYLVRCGKVNPEAPIAERDYDRKIFAEMELEPAPSAVPAA